MDLFEIVGMPCELAPEPTPAKRQMPRERIRSAETSKLVRIQFLRLTTTVLSQSLPSKISENPLRPGKGLLPLTFRLNFGQEPFAQGVLLALAQLRGLIKGLLENFRHGMLILPPRLIPLGIRRRTACASAARACTSAAAAGFGDRVLTLPLGSGRAAKDACHTEIFVDIGPVNAFTVTEELPIRPLHG